MTNIMSGFYSSPFQSNLPGSENTSTKSNYGGGGANNNTAGATGLHANALAGSTVDLLLTVSPLKVRNT
jgi:hypothetical protein